MPKEKSQKPLQDDETTRVCFVMRKSEFRDMKIAAAMASLTASDMLRQACSDFVTKTHKTAKKR